MKKNFQFYEYMESRMIQEIDAMPYGLTRRQINKLLIKTVKKVGKDAAKKLGIFNPQLQGLVDLFLFANAFPDFPNECYESILRGEKMRVERIGEIDKNGKFHSYN